MNPYKIPALHMNESAIATEYGRVISFPKHIHSYCEMILYEPFDGFVNINGHIICPTELTATLIIPGDFHEIVLHGSSDTAFRKIFFSGTLFEKNILPKTSMVLRNIDRDTLFYQAYAEIFRPSANEPLKKALTQVLACMLTQNGQPIPALSFPEGDRYSTEAVRLINEQFDEDLTLSSVAKTLAITPQYLSNTFKSHLGISFSHYLTATRLRHAENLLLETGEPITNVCALCGYGNFSHFIRSFKKTYGVSPSVYRKHRHTPDRNP